MTGHRKIRYGPGRSQYVELFAPPGDGPFPVAVVIHGGFWKARYDRKLMHGLCEDLRSRGWAAWNLEYRRIGWGSDGGWPNTLEDAAAGIDKLADSTANDGLPLDLQRVVAIGHSAGGHLALWAAARHRLPEGAPGAAPRVAVTAAVGQAAVADLELAFDLELSHGVVVRFLGGTPVEVPERYALASPAELLPLGVPTLLTHGGRDDIVPALMSERFARAAGSDLVLLPDEDHFGHIDPRNPLWTAVVEWIR